MKTVSIADIQKLTAEKAWQWLFDVKEAFSLDPSHRPVKRLEIDEQVDLLKQRANRKGSKIRLSIDEEIFRRTYEHPIPFSQFEFVSSMEELLEQLESEPPKHREAKAAATSDPFFVARWILWRSLISANYALSNSQHAQKRARELQRLAADVDKLRSACDRLSNKRFEHLFDNPFNIDGPTLDIDEHTKRMIGTESQAGNLRDSLLESVWKMGTLSKEARAEARRLTPTGNRGDIWKQTFVEMIGHGWFLMTGRFPARNGPFDDFANAAYRSIGGTDTLDRAIRTVLQNVAKRPEEDRFDRDMRKQPADENGYVPRIYYQNGQRILQRSSVWAPFFDDPELDNPSFEPWDDEAAEVQANRRAQKQGRARRTDR